MSKRLQVGEDDNTISTAYVRMQAPQMPSPVPGQSGPVPAPKHFRMVPSWLHCEKWWCGRGDLNPHDLLGSADFHTTSAFAAPLSEFVVWTIPSPSLLTEDKVLPI
jgi:hypothetical protein